MENAMGAMPVYDVCDNNGFGSGFGGTWMFIFFLFFLLSWGVNGFGFGNNGALTRAELHDGFNFNQLDNGIRGLERGQCQLGYDSLMQAKDIQYQLAQNAFQSQQCCCETNRNIDAVRYENAQNTCAITSAIHAEGEATRALINQNTMQDLRDKLSERDRELMAANYQISQVAQTNTLIDTLRPCAIPAYITCSPYTAMNYNGFGCGYNTGCGC